MGYASNGHQCLVLDGPVDLDKVTVVARDCLLAYVECQVCHHYHSLESQIFLLFFMSQNNYPVIFFQKAYMYLQFYIHNVAFHTRTEIVINLKSNSTEKCEVIGPKAICI